jgi:hypothetical protein
MTVFTNGIGTDYPSRSSEFLALGRDLDNKCVQNRIPTYRADDILWICLCDYDKDWKYKGDKENE